MFTVRHERHLSIKVILNSVLTDVKPSGVTATVAHGATILLLQSP
jgi:hypothetical protein